MNILNLYYNNCPMARPIEKELYKTLKENELDFIPRGIYHIEEIYDFIKNEYHDLCDDNYLYIQHCRGGKNAPEWKHAVIWPIKIAHIN